MTNDELQLLRQKAEEEHRKNLDAIERVFRMSQGIMLTTPKVTTETAALDAAETNSEDVRSEEGNQGGKEGVATASRLTNKTAKPKKGDIARAVRAFVGRVHGNFTILDIEKQLAETGMAALKSSMHVTLTKLKDEGVIEVESAGIGRRPTIYRKT